METQVTNRARTGLKGLARLAMPVIMLAGLGACQEGVDDVDSSGAAQTIEPQTDGAPEVTVAEGKLQGKLSGTTRTFLGIPYAQAPVGKLRFAAPEPALAWDGVKQAVAHGPSCPQNPGALSAPGPQSEDCLSLNVYAPERAAKLPVIVWIHGGAFVAGGSNQYDGTRLAGEGPVLVVTLNYRLGALGFFAHAGLDATRTAPSGNDAIRDQALALRWVQRNIAAFGGDPDNVTVVGESAGSASACTHLVSPESQSLATRFVLESGSCTGGLPFGTKAKSDALGDELATALCGDAADKLACLREKPAAEVVAWGASRGLTGAGWSPIVNANDPVLPASPIALIKAGKHNRGAVLLGTNKNEWGLFLAIAPQSPVNSLATFDTQLNAQFGPASALIKAHYAPTEQTANATFVKLMTDGVFRCPTRQLARLTSAQGAKVYLYSFEEGMAFHAFEIPYVFGNPSPTLAPVLVEPLRKSVQAYWRSFAADGDPNVAGEATWPTYDAATDQHLVLKAASEAGSGLASSDCDFWDKLSAAAPAP
ncbi:MAG: carboxylesterase family protein [Polyangiales bacterium]